MFLISLITCSMNPETAVTFTRGHFNQVLFAVIYVTVSAAFLLRCVVCGYKHLTSSCQTVNSNSYQRVWLDGHITAPSKMSESVPESFINTSAV